MFIFLTNLIPVIVFSPAKFDLFITLLKIDKDIDIIKEEKMNDNFPVHQFYSRWIGPN